MIEATCALRDEMNALSFSAPVCFVYNPLVYAWDCHRAYLERFAAHPKEVVLFGMNPGPFGMAQTGIPFGEIDSVSSWMSIRCAVHKPPREHPKRRVLGFACPRREVSGARLWGAIRACHPQPASFFSRHLVLNLCPLLFLAESGANLTPDKLVAAERATIEAACDRFLARVLEALKPRVALGVGAWAEKRIRQTVAAHHTNIEVARLPHPSPQSPLANRDWAGLARKALLEADIEPFL